MQLGNSLKAHNLRQTILHYLLVVGQRIVMLTEKNWLSNVTLK
jgi:hypothetical protein